MSKTADYLLDCETAPRIDAITEEMRKLLFSLSPAGQIVTLVEEAARRAFELNQRYGIDSTAALLKDLSDIQRKYSLTLEDDIDDAALNDPDSQDAALSDEAYQRKVDDKLSENA